MEKLAELRRKLGALTDQLTEAVDDAKEFTRLEKEIADTEGAIQRAEAAQKRSASLARPANGGEDAVWAPPARALGINDAITGGYANAKLGNAARQFDGYLARARSALANAHDPAQRFVPDPQKHFRSFGEQLIAVYNEKMTGRADPRLQRGNSVDDRFNRAPSGASEVDPTGGGFLIQTDFSTAIWMLAHDMGELLGRVNKIPLSANANGIKIPGVDETSRATGSRWGGVQSYWVGEGTSVTNTKPKF